MTEREDTIMDIRDYFAECRKNAQEGTAAYNRFGIYIDTLQDILALLKKSRTPDCEHANHDGAGCLGYSGWQEDEPIEACKECAKYTGNVVEEWWKRDDS